MLLVIAFHSGFSVPGGFTGVDIFFAISGFVITGTLLAELESKGRISFPRFYLRRIKRLLPALALVLLFVALVGMLADPVGAQRMGALTGIFASVFSANIYLDHLSTDYFALNTALNPLLHTWTLAVEEQFYLLFPALLAVGWWFGSKAILKRRARPVAAFVIVGVCIASFLLAYALPRGYTPVGPTRGIRFSFYSAPTRAWEFGAGALVVLATPLVLRIPSWLTRLAGVLGAIALAVTALSHLSVNRTPEVAVMLPVAGTCLLLGAGIGESWGVSRLLGLRPLTWVGDLSYSLYLWHWPFIVFAKALYPYHPHRTAAAAAALSLLPAWLSYRFVENPIRYSARLRPSSLVVKRAAAALVGICILVPMAANAGLLRVKEAVSHSDGMTGWKESQKPHLDETAGCQSEVPLGERKEGGCTWRVARARGDIILLGDSQAGQYSEPVIRAGKREGFNVSLATYDACPSIGLRQSSTLWGEKTGCVRFGHETISTLVKRKPSLVFLALRTDLYVLDYHYQLAAPGAKAFATSTEGKTKLWMRALRSTLTRLNDAGIPVILIQPPPQLSVDINDCAVARLLIDKCARTVSRSWFMRLMRPLLARESAVVRSTPASWVMSIADKICSATECSTVRGDIVQFRNNMHLSIAGALKLTGSFQRLIAAHAVPRVSKSSASTRSATAP